MPEVDQVVGGLGCADDVVDVSAGAALDVLGGGRSARPVAGSAGRVGPPGARPVQVRGPTALNWCETPRGICMSTQELGGTITLCRSRQHPVGGTGQVVGET
ncbi:hypothetical protein GCM10017744_003260 [Streptomyces antimycoticus]|uniref:Uncharacterized protein n=1 Tax=Streptomyces antimycoticus TaxID=68175 RepID=A0A4D4KQR7_9ACTN|nr:hypothetical protein SANT12839_096390 [Streptomyces antimycoticus]